MSNRHERIVELVAENPATGSDELVAMAEEDGFDAEVARDLLTDALEDRDVLEFDGKHWVVREGEYSFSEYDHPKS